MGRGEDLRARSYPPRGGSARELLSPLKVLFVPEAAELLRLQQAERQAAHESLLLHKRSHNQGFKQSSESEAQIREEEACGCQRQDLPPSPKRCSAASPKRCPRKT